MRYGAIKLADSGAITFETNGSISSSGTSGTLTLSSGAGGTAGAGGSLTLQSGAGGSTSGAGGSLQLLAGSAAGSTGGAGGAVALTAGNAAGTSGGAGGGVTLTAGNGAGTNQAGGAITLSGGTPTGSGTPGGVTLTAASSASSTGANVVLTAGAGSVLANDGFVQISRVPTSNRAARLRFVADNATTVDLKAPTAVTSYALTLPTAQGAASTFLQNDGAGALSWVAGNSGTVTTLSVVTTNGFAGTVANPTTTPAITLTTSVTGVLVGNATSMAAAAAGTTTDTAIVTWNGSAANNLRNNTLTISGQTISTPSAAAGNAVNITGGAGSSTTGGNVVITGGAPTGANTPGAVSILGAAAAGATTGGLVTLAGGDSTSNLGGNVVLRGGRGSVVANDGFIQIDRTTTDNRATRLRFVADNATTVDLKAPTAVTSYALTLPTAQGAASTFLQNDGAGVLSWVAGSGGTVTGTGTANTVPTWSASTALQNSTASASTVLLGGSDAATGGILTVRGGNATSSGVGGQLNLTGGAGAGTTQTGGAVVLTGGAGGTTTSAGGNVTITGGAPGTTGTPGAVTISGAAAAGAVTGGLVTLAGGDSTTNVGGNVTLRGGRGSVVANDGFIQIDRTTTDNRATRLRFVADNATTVDLKAPAAVTSYAMTLPTAAATVNGQKLSSTTAGVLSWSNSGSVLQTLFTEISADTTTTSTTFTGLLSQAITTVAGSIVMVWFSTGCSNSNNNAQVAFRLTIDGTAIRGVGSVAASGASNVGSCALVYRSSGLAAGAHTFAIQWLVSANTGRIRPATVPNLEHASLIIQEVAP